MNIDDILSNLKETAQGCEGGPDDHAFIALSRAQDILRECKAAGFVTETGEVMAKAGCFFCQDCDAVKCEDVVSKLLRRIAENAGKRQWWNALVYVRDLLGEVVRCLHRDINLSAEAARKAGVTMKEKAQ